MAPRSDQIILPICLHDCRVHGMTDITVGTGDLIRMESVTGVGRGPRLCRIAGSLHYLQSGEISGPNRFNGQILSIIPVSAYYPQTFSPVLANDNARQLQGLTESCEFFSNHRGMPGPNPDWKIQRRLFEGLEISPCDEELRIEY